MSLWSKLSRGWRIVLTVVIVHALVFMFLGWLASQLSEDRPELSVNGSYLRLVPLDER